MVEQLNSLDPADVAANLARIKAAIASAAASVGRDPGDVEVVAAVKYVPTDLVGVLAEAGVRVLGENRAQALAEKQGRWPDSFEWDFIGDLQSRKVPALIGKVRLIHSVASESALRRLEGPGGDRQRILIQVNVSGEEGKSGIEPAALGDFIARSPSPVAGLMTMPPLAADGEESRPWFRQLAGLAAEHGLEHLSMGTSQDFEVAVEEGATLVRIGSDLYLPSGGT